MDKDLDRSEWNFKSCPDEELTACLNWEYLRQIIRLDPDVVKRILHPFIPIEMHCPGAKPRLVEWDDDPEMEARRADFETQRDLSKYFPERPYLTLPADYRARLLALQTSRVGYHVGERILEIKSGDTVPHIWSDEPAGRFEVVSIGIDWALTPTALMGRIKEIIEARRGDRKANDPKGTALNKFIRDRLKRLGALRVWRHWAANFGEVQHSNAKGLYRTRQAWIKHTGQAADDVRLFGEALENRF
jgi:hypothetical protein